MKDTVTLSPKARSIAESRAREEGFSSIDSYVDALIQEDQENLVAQDWIKRRIEEGLSSSSAGELSKDKLKRLVHEGIARASRRE
jgi:hypothetical protein